ncbi:hypothetical protein PUN28_018154 [Cardiocondyla obscurior]|uniref:Uncharacterized protein n=1 Tax=Cardiocondyla obscurior TaxID=286306 RepID=A0AAW2ELZ4_9HYME
MHANENHINVVFYTRLKLFSVENKTKKKQIEVVYDWNNCANYISPCACYSKISKTCYIKGISIIHFICLLCSSANPVNGGASLSRGTASMSRGHQTAQTRIATTASLDDLQRVARREFNRASVSHTYANPLQYQVMSALLPERICNSSDARKQENERDEKKNKRKKNKRKKKRRRTRRHTLVFMPD